MLSDTAFVSVTDSQSKLSLSSDISPEGEPPPESSGTLNKEQEIPERSMIQREHTSKGRLIIRSIFPHEAASVKLEFRISHKFWIPDIEDAANVCEVFRQHCQKKKNFRSFFSINIKINFYIGHSSIWNNDFWRLLTTQKMRFRQIKQQKRKTKTTDPASNDYSNLRIFA